LGGLIDRLAGLEGGSKSGLPGCRSVQFQAQLADQAAAVRWLCCCRQHRGGRAGGHDLAGALGIYFGRYLGRQPAQVCAPCRC
jgi:hypothetical protein